MRVLDFIKNLWIPIVVIGTAGTAGTIRVMRGNLLDVLGEPYVTTARAKGVKERIVTRRHAVRIAFNPFVSSLGMTLPALLSGEAITSIVLNLPTAGPLLLDAVLGRGHLHGRQHPAVLRDLPPDREPAGRHRPGHARPPHPLRLAAR